MDTVSPESVGMSSERLARIRPAIQSFIDRRVIPGAITLVARHGKVAHFECHGMMDVEAGKPMRPNAIFRIYSMTKPITSVAVMMLVEEGRLLLSDPVAKYLPAFKDMRVYAGRDASGAMLTVPAERAITVFDLLTHTSGLGYEAIDDHPVEHLIQSSGIFAPTTGLAVSLDEMADRIAAIPLVHQPGTRWRYSIATDLVGYLVQIVSGVPFDAFLTERIFRPLGMNDTGFFVPAPKVERFSACYKPNPAGSEALSDASFWKDYLQEDRVPSGGGGLVSTASDYLRFAQTLLNGGELDDVRLISRKSVALMTTNHLSHGMLPLTAGASDWQWHGDGFGLGVCVRIGNEAGTLGSMGMYGWDGAAGTRFRVDPAEDLLFIYAPQLRAFPGAIAAMFQNLLYQALN